MEWTRERVAELAFECVQTHKRLEFEFLSNFLHAYCLEHPEDKEAVVRFLGDYTTAREIRAEHSDGYGPEPHAYVPIPRERRCRVDGCHRPQDDPIHDDGSRRATTDGFDK